MLSRLPIKLLVGLSFTIMLGLLVTVATIALVGVKQFADDVVTYRGLARDSNLASEVQSNLLSMRLNIKDYLITHSDHDLKQYHEYLDLMNQNLDEARVEIQKPERAETVLKIISLRDDYVGRFEKVIDSISQENTLIDERVNVYGQQLRERLTTIMQSAFDDNDASAAFIAGRAQEQLLLGRLYMARYHKTHEQASFERAQEEIVDNLHASIQVLDRELQNPHRRELLADFIAAYAPFVASINELHSILTERDQLVINGLDKVGPEIARFSESVKLSVKSDQDSLGPQVQKESEDLVNYLAIDSAIAVIVGIVLSLLLIRAIWRPLGAEPRLLLDLIGRMADGDLSSEVKDQDGNNSGVFAGILQMRQQLSDNIEHERKAAAENSRLRQALDNTTANVLVSDNNHKVIYLNNGARRLFAELESDMRTINSDFSATSVVGRQVDSLYARSAEELQVLKQLDSSHTQEITLGVHLMEITANPICDAEQGNERLGTVFEWVDLTDERRLEEEKSQNIEREREDGLAMKAKVDQILEVVNAAASGDLTREIEVTGDDAVGQVGTCLKSFFHELRDSLTTIGQTAESLKSSSQGLSDINVGLNNSAQSTASQADLVSSTSEQINDNVSSVATAAVEMTASVREISNSATEAAAVATEAVQLAEDTDERVKQLSVSSKDIGNVIKVINSIAEQTNLLALNATIEAARAGDSGKGFAVVANEVKELAKQTAVATDEISQKISAIQHDSDVAVSAIGDINETINRIHDIQTTIASAVEEQSATTREISRSATEAASGTAEIAISISDVAKGAEQARDETNNAQHATVEQEELAQALNKLVSRFKLGDGETSRTQA